VLPAAGWGEKTGSFTNVDRTVHLSQKAVEPPGEARSDLEILLAYADAMGFTDQDGEPLVKWRTPEEAFAAWSEASRGRPCDYTGITYDLLRGPSGVQWPKGVPRLYADAVFPTDTEQCETYGHDLVTGASVSEQEHRAQAPAGRAFLKGAAYSPPHEEPSEDFPFRLTTGRTVYQFHTRTKTARSRPLDEAAPHAWVEIAAADAARLGVTDGEPVRLESPRGAIEVPARISEVTEGAVFVPFHYGDHPANELTMTVWDPVSKQPTFKTAACRVTPVSTVERS
jgi:ferredoxin-nitrate reductase